MKKKNSIFNFRISESSPRYIFLFLIFLILFLELAIMMVFKDLDFNNHLINALIDAAVLIIIITPFLYFFVYRPNLFYIREFKTIAQAKEESEKKYREIVENSRDAIIVHEDGKILIINNQSLRLMRLTDPSDLIGKSVFQFIHPDYREMVIERMKKVAIEGSNLPLIVEKFIRPDGSVIDAEVKSMAIRYENRTAVQVIIRDITERKQEKDEQEVIYEITSSVATTNNLQELLKLIQQSLGKVVYADNIFVALYDQNTKLFSFPFWVDQFDSIPEPVAMQKSLSYYVFRTGKPFLFTPESFEWLKEQNEVEFVGSYSPSWVGIPLVTPSGTLGVLVLQHYEKENVYSEQDVQFLNSVGSQIAWSIERKRVEEELKENEEMFRRLFDESADPILILDETGFTNCNLATVSLLGYASKKEFLNKNPWELSPERQPDGMLSSEKAQMMMDKAISEGYNRFEWIHTKSDGSDAQVEVMLTPVLLKGKQVLYTIWRDITERKLAEEELHNEHLLLRTVIDNIPDSIYGKDIEGRKTLANLTELNYSGVKTESEIIGKTDFDLHPKEIAEGFFEDDQIVLQTGQPVINREEYVIDINNRKRWLLTSKLPLKDDFGNIIGLVGIGRDITGRKQAEEALRESEVRLNVILESTADGILAVDGNGRIIKTNKRFAELWNIPTTLIDSDDDNAFIGFVLDQLDNPDEFIAKVQKLYQSTDEDLDFLHFRDGRTFERFSAPMVMADSTIGRVWSFRDVTESILSEQKIKKRNEQLLILNAEKDKFFSIIAHDLKNPFNSMLGFSEILFHEYDMYDEETRKKMIELIHQSTQNTYKLLENLLDWARMQTGKIEFNPSVVNLKELVDENIALLNQTGIKKNILLQSEIIKDLRVNTDKNLINTVIRNLLTNALKFTPQKGNVTISARTIPGNYLDENIEISVKDTGIGMTRESIENLFKIDKTLSKQGTEGEKGTGLGLILCKEFVEKCGGKISVKSEEGKGSTFYFSIPKNSNLQKN